MGLFKPIHRMFAIVLIVINSAYFVKSTPQLSIFSFDTLQICARDIEDMHEEVLC